MLDIDDIASIEAETKEDEISGKFCECGHLIDEEHYVGEFSKSSKCFALTFNGTVWSSCRCNKLVHLVFRIKVMVEEHAENLPNAA